MCLPTPRTYVNPFPSSVSFFTDLILQILAWNGGGSSNYTDIVNKGRSSKQVDLKTDTLHKLEDLIDSEVEQLKSHFKELLHDAM